MNRKYKLLAGLLVCAGLAACDDEPTTPVDPTSSFAALCEASGGTYKDELTCTCGGKECSPNDVCNYTTKSCPDGGDASLSFADACTRSGGTPNGNFCSCGGYQCKEYETCASDKACPVPVPKGDLKFEVACQKTGGTLEGDSFCVCDGKKQKEYNTCVSDKDLKFAEACTNTGGTPDGHYCTCGGEKCREYETCDAELKKCPSKSGGSEGCGDADEITFEAACKASGGDAAGGICVCNQTGCGQGAVCNFNSHDCSDSPQMCSTKVEGVKCSAGDPNCAPSCKNELSVGKLYLCNGSTFEKQTCKDAEDHEVSCKSETECGSCKNYTQLCENNADGIGQIKMCQDGVSGNTIANCGDVSCRTDVPTCGECKNDELKCTEDNDNNAIMWRCVDGTWNRIENKLDPYDPGYACPAACTEGTDPQKMEYECDTSQCDKCDPCWGEPMVGAPSNPNPCYDENRCKEVRKAEDKDYPPFRGFDWAKEVKDTRVLKEVTGYDFTDYTSTTTDERTHPFDIDLTNGKRRVSCNADGTYFGQCHNSLQLCVNEEYHKKGFIIQCAKGELTDYDGNGDGIACKCERLQTNAEGCCYTRSSCFKLSSATSGPELCNKPEAKDDKGNYGYE